MLTFKNCGSNFIIRTSELLFERIFTVFISSKHNTAGAGMWQSVFFIRAVILPFLIIIRLKQSFDIYDFIQNLPDRYETVIGERGVKLSGGQKQRLAIARTLLYDPEIVVFDEATSSLDSENEKAIVSTIKHLTNGKTVITIAHRLSSILDANRVAVMNEGKIVAYGPHSELKGKNEIYDLLFAKQYNMEVQN